MSLSKPKRADSASIKGYYLDMMSYCIAMAEQYRETYNTEKADYIKSMVDNRIAQDEAYRKAKTPFARTVRLVHFETSADYEFQNSVRGKGLIADNQDYQRQADMYSNALTAMLLFETNRSLKQPRLRQDPH